MSGYIGVQPVPQATQRREYFTATSGQTTFNTNGYTPGYIDVFMNGVKLSPSDFTATNGSDVVLASGAATGDLLQVISFTPFNVANQTFVGNVNLSSGAYQIGGNTVIDSSRIGSLESLSVGTTNTSAQLVVGDDTDSTATLLQLRNDDSTYSQSWTFSSDTSKDLVITGASGSGGIKLSPGSRGVDVNAGPLKVGGTTVIDSSRNIFLPSTGDYLSLGGLWRLGRNVSGNVENYEGELYASDSNNRPLHVTRNNGDKLFTFDVLNNKVVSHNLLETKKVSSSSANSTVYGNTTDTRNIGNKITAQNTDNTTGTVTGLTLFTGSSSGSAVELNAIRSATAYQADFAIKARTGGSTYNEMFRLGNAGTMGLSYSDVSSANPQYGQFEILKDDADTEWSYLSFHEVGSIAWQMGINTNNFTIGKTGGVAKTYIETEYLTITSAGKTGIGTPSPASHLTVESTATNTADVLRLVSHNDGGAGTTGVHIDTYHDKPTAQDNTDVPFMLSMSAKDDGGNNHTYGRITQQIDSRSNGAEKGSLRFWSAQSPTLTELVRMGNGAALAIPTTSNNGIYLGDTPGDYSAYGSGVPTIDIRGTASANRRAGAITFREQDSTLAGAIYSTYGGDGYAGLNFHSTTEAIKFAIGDSTSGPADDIITMEGGSYKGRLNVNYVDGVAANGGIGGVYAYNGFIGANEISASGSDNDANVRVRVTINTSTSVWRAGYAWVYASSCGTGGQGPVTAWWFYRFRTYNSSIGAIAVMDSGGDTSSFSVSFSDDGDPDADGTSLVIGIRVASLHSTANDETVMGVRVGTREGPPRAAERISG